MGRVDAAGGRRREGAAARPDLREFLHDRACGGRRAGNRTIAALPYRGRARHAAAGGAVRYFSARQGFLFPGHPGAAGERTSDKAVRRLADRGGAVIGITRRGHAES